MHTERTIGVTNNLCGNKDVRSKLLCCVIRAGVVITTRLRIDQLVTENLMLRRPTNDWVGIIPVGRLRAFVSAIKVVDQGGKGGVVIDTRL